MFYFFYFKPLKILDASLINNCGEAVAGILIGAMKMDTVIEDVTRASLIAMGRIVVKAVISRPMIQN